MKSVQLGNTRWHYQEKGTGTPLVFVHGFPMDHRIWTDQLEALSATHRVIAVDLKGFGQSASTEAFTIDSMADELVAFLRAVGAAPCVLAGLSMGGYIAFSLAARCPEVLRGLIIVSSKSEADPPPAREGRQKMAELAQKSGAKAVAEQMLPRLFGDDALKHRPDLVQRLRGIMEACPPMTIANASFAMRDRTDRTPDLAKLTMPVLILLGENDHLIPAEMGQKMASSCPQGQFVVVKNAGHMAPMERPAEVNAAITAFSTFPPPGGGGLGRG